MITNSSLVFVHRVKHAAAARDIKMQPYLQTNSTESHHKHKLQVCAKLQGVEDSIFFLHISLCRKIKQKPYTNKLFILRFMIDDYTNTNIYTNNLYNYKLMVHYQY